jgi:hypothetical protein
MKYRKADFSQVAGMLPSNITICLEFKQIMKMLLDIEAFAQIRFDLEIYDRPYTELPDLDVVLKVPFANLILATLDNEYKLTNEDEITVVGLVVNDNQEDKSNSMGLSSTQSGSKF